MNNIPHAANWDWVWYIVAKEGRWGLYDTYEAVVWSSSPVWWCYVSNPRVRNGTSES